MDEPATWISVMALVVTVFHALHSSRGVKIEALEKHIEALEKQNQLLREQLAASIAECRHYREILDEGDRWIQ